MNALTKNNLKWEETVANIENSKKKKPSKKEDKHPDQKKEVQYVRRNLRDRGAGASQSTKS